MKPLAQVVQQNRILRVIGFDDAPFDPVAGAPVHIAGVVCADSVFEGMLWGTAHRDAEDATETIAELVLRSKFHAQIHLVLLDGLAIGGFNLIDLPELQRRLQRPCVAVMRKRPDLDKVRAAIEKLPNAEYRLRLMEKAGEIHYQAPFHFQCCGATPQVIGQALTRITVQGHVPEALRIAHLIGAAVMTGESTHRA